MSKKTPSRIKHLQNNLLLLRVVYSWELALNTNLTKRLAVENINGSKTACSLSFSVCLYTCS